MMQHPVTPGLFAAAFAALFAAHQFADHWLQANSDALSKGGPGWRGRRACARHVAVLTAALAVALAVTALATGARFSVPWTAAALAVNAVTHFWADRRSTLAAFAARIGKGVMWGIGQPRAGRDDNACLGTGAYALDQSFHTFFLLVTALIIAGGSR